MHETPGGLDASNQQQKEGRIYRAIQPMSQLISWNLPCRSKSVVRMPYFFHYSEIFNVRFALSIWGEHACSKVQLQSHQNTEHYILLSVRSFSPNDNQFVIDATMQTVLPGVQTPRRLAFANSKQYVIWHDILTWHTAETWTYLVRLRGLSSGWIVWMRKTKRAIRLAKLDMTWRGRSWRPVESKFKPMQLYLSILGGVDNRKILRRRRRAGWFPNSCTWAFIASLLVNIDQNKEQTFLGLHLRCFKAQNSELGSCIAGLACAEESGG